MGGENLELIVKDLKLRDVARAIARLDFDNMTKLGIWPGDFIKVQGKAYGFARAMPCYPEDKGQPFIRLDAALRTTIGASIDSMVTVSKASPEEIQGLPGGTTGKCARTGNPVTYADIGGLCRELDRIRELVEIPLRHPEVFDHLGIQPPKGILLYGPPGCGKTLLAKAIANETKARFYHISGPEIIGKYYGESEAKLRAVFEEARSSAPSIVFIDEVDAIAPKREDMGPEKQVERRVVSQLLSIMDGLDSRGNVIVIAATNMPNSIDPALRRPGRFDREIHIGVPDRQGRLEILRIHTKTMPLDPDVDLEHLAEVTHGFVGADLAALCREAAMGALRRSIPEHPEFARLTVKMCDFQEALSEIEPSAIREFFSEIPETRWSDIRGLDKVKDLLVRNVVWPVKYHQLYRQFKVEPPAGVLFYGPPGNGKTLTARALACESGLNFISINGPELISKYLGESEKALRELFVKARQASPCILFFDELDSILRRRNGSDEERTSERVISQFLVELDGIAKRGSVIVIGATNRPEALEPSVLRPGRFELLVEFPLPDEHARRSILKVHAANLPLSPDVDLVQVAAITDGFSGAELAFVCREAARRALQRTIEEKTYRPLVTKEDFAEAVDVARKRRQDQE